MSVGPVDLDQRVADRLAGLERDQPAELLAPRLDPGADLAQDPAALVGGQVAGDLERRDRGLDGLLVLRLGGVERGAGRLAGSAGLATSSGSGESTQRPARKIGCGLAPAVMVIGWLPAESRRVRVDDGIALASSGGRAVSVAAARRRP